MLKNPIQKFFNKRRFFRKTVLVFMGILLACVLSVATILTQALKQPLQNSISKTHQGLLQQVRSTTDAYILEQIDTILIQNFLNYQSNADLKQFFQMDGTSERNMSDFFHIYQYLASLNNNFDFLESLSIYNPRSQVYISSTRGVTFADGNNTVPVNPELLDQFLNTTDISKLWVTPSENMFSYQDENIITLICSVPIIRTGNTLRGCVLFNIDMNNLIGYLGSFLPVEEMDILILDQTTGRLIASNHYDEQKETDYLWLTEMTQNQSEGLAEHGDSSVIWANSTASDWSYIAILPIEAVYSDLIQSTQFAIWITLAIIVVAGLIVYIAVVRLHEPIRRLAQSVTNAFPSGNPADELQMIDSVINQLSTRVTDLESTLDDHQELIKNQIVLDILNGNISELEEVQSRLSIVGIPFQYAYYAVTFTELNGHRLAQMDYEQREYLFYTTLHTLEDFWGKNGACLSIRYNNYIISILATNQAGVQGGYPKKMNVGVNLNICLCPYTDDILALHVDFQKLVTYMQYGFIYGFGNVFTAQEIERYERIPVTLPDHFFSNLENLLKAGKTDEIKKILSQLTRDIQKNGCSFRDTQSVLLQIINLICQWAREHNPVNDAFSKSRLLSEFNHAASLTEFEQWVNSILDVYGETFQTRGKDIKNEFVEKIAAYITGHITENLSLNSVADAFNISPSYLSRIFKETLDVNFSVFVNTKKFEAATEMLVDKENRSVTEIAEKLGYYNMPYFNRQFKERFGLSPLQYRKLHLSRQVDAKEDGDM